METSVSAIIACHNGATYLSEAVAGLRHQGVQIEIIVIDDASTDNSPYLAAELGCIVRTISHSGQAAARNLGLRLAQGEFVLFHDQDDNLNPNSLRRMVDALSDDATGAAAMAQAKDFISPELDARTKASIKPRVKPYFGFLGATLFRRSIFSSLGGFSAKLRAGEAADLLYRLKKSGLTILRLPFVAMNRRLHASNASRLFRDTQFTDYAAMLRNNLNLQR